MTVKFQTSRLTDHLRNTIKERLLNVAAEKQFSERLASLFARSKNLADTCYKARFSADEIAKMNRLPEGWLPELDYIMVRFGGDHATCQKLHFNGYSRFLPWKTTPKSEERPADIKRRFLAMHERAQPHLHFTKNDPEGKAYFELANAGEAIEKERKKLEEQISEVLFSVTTTGKLVEIWPEVRPILAKLAPTAPVANLPVKVMNDLNTKLGLDKAA